MNQNFRAIDLFAGIGGIRLGFEQVFKDKIKFVYANEIDPYACKTYQENFGENYRKYLLPGEFWNSCGV